MRIRIHNPIYGVPITFLDKWRPFEPVYILNPDRYANEYIISPNIKPFISVSCLIPKQFRIIDLNPHFFSLISQDLPKPKQLTLHSVNKKDPYARVLIKKISE